MADLSAEGVFGSPFVVRIEAGKISEFAGAVGSEHPAHIGADAVVPPTFLTVQNFYEKWGGSEADPWQALKLNPERELHAGQEYVFHGPPPRAGDVLLAQSRIESVTRRRSAAGQDLVFAVMVTEYRDRTGALVAEARCTGVETGEATDD